MLHRYPTALMALFVVHGLQALTPMPDANLRTWVNNNYSGAIVGSNIDETHPGVQSATYIDLQFAGNISDLMGMQAFSSLGTLNVSGNPITYFMGPQSLHTLIANNCGLTGTFIVPLPVQTMLASYNSITTLDLSVAQQLNTLYAHHNQLTNIIGSNGSVGSMDLSYNQLTTIPDNFQSLYSLDISHNLFATLPGHFGPLNMVNASYNLITSFTFLPEFSVDLSHNLIDHVTSLGSTQTVNLSFNPLTQGMDNTSYDLVTLTITDTQLPCLPYLHNALVNLYCTNSPLTCLPNQPPNLVMSAVNFGFPPAVCTSIDPCYQQLPSIALRVFLQGPFNTATLDMHDSLRAQGLLPTVEPYTALGFSYTGAGWPDTLDPAVFNATGSDAIVDWIVVDMAVDNGVLNPGDAEHYSRPALLQRDGDVVALDGSWPLPLAMRFGSYRTAVRHRNHLGAIVRFGENFGSATSAVDFTLYTATACFSEAMHGDSLLFNERQLWSGDVTWNRQIKYVGVSNDRDPILQAIGGIQPLNVVSGVYSNADVNMDGQIKYTGFNNDRDPILVNIGGWTPLAVRNQIGFY
ncbi:MAG: hypothetical protein IPI55_02525 [Flavobacteriales bacterium]|nr:hypothetical protein [Flavobacteriales bacterium]